MPICRICGEDKLAGTPFDAWVKDTFMNIDNLRPGEIICDDCLFWFDDNSTELQHIMGKDKPQRMRNYSHFVIDGQWIPASKADKRRMQELLLGGKFPELAVIAVSGQKHIAFRARRNPPGQDAGWVQLEETSLWTTQDALAHLLGLVEDLYIGFSKGEIAAGNYSAHRAEKFGLKRLMDLEGAVRPVRRTALFDLALFLAQRSEDGNNEGSGGDPAEVDLAGHPGGLQVPLPDDNLGSV